MQLFREQDNYVILDEKTGNRFVLSREEAKHFARLLLLNLNIIDAELYDGRFLLEIDDKFKTLLKTKYSEEQLNYVKERRKNKKAD